MLYVHFPPKYLSSFLILPFSMNLLAQDAELVKIQSAYYPRQTIEESAVDGEIGFFEWGAQVAIPNTFKKNKNTILIHKFSYGNLSTNTEANLSPVMLTYKKYYHTISYNLVWAQTLGENWLLVASLAPTLASDFEENLSGDDLLYQANAFTVIIKNEKLKYGFGLSYTTRFGRQLVIPIGLLKYKTKKFELDIELPNSVSAMIKTPSNFFSYGLKAGLNGGVFNNATELRTVSSIIDKVGYSRLIMGPAITLRLRDAININLHGGMTVGRRLEFIDINEEIIDRTPLAVPFMGLGLSFAPKMKSNKAALIKKNTI